MFDKVETMTDRPARQTESLEASLLKDANLEFEEAETVQDDPYFQNIAQEEGPQHQVIDEAGFLYEDGEAILALDEKLIGIPNWAQWDVKGKSLTLLLMDGSTVDIRSPLKEERIDVLRNVRRVKIASLWDPSNNEYIVHHIPFTVQDF